MQLSVRNATRKATAMKLKNSEVTKAVQQYARRNGLYVRTVRDVSNLRYQAIREYKEKMGFAE